MGAVGQLAAAELARQLRPYPLAEIDPEPFFDPTSVAIRAGRIEPRKPPRTAVLGWKDPKDVRDLLLLVGEQQPERTPWAYCRAVIELAASHGVERVCTFAALASQLPPGESSRVHAAATSDPLLAELRRIDVVVLERGEIGGLNGLLLAAALERSISGVCLLGEFPFLAANVPNPRASAAILERFARLAGVPVDPAPLLASAPPIEKALLDHLAAAAAGAEERDQPAPAERAEDAELARRIELLFAAARTDRSKARELKLELDRAGLFKRYEDRFLDLFRAGS